MADEVLGNVYEVLTQVALEDHTKVVKKGEKVFFEQKPKGITIKPDLTIGKDKDRPRIIIQISHTNAERASEKKFWRNVGEFVDARLALGDSAVIANIVFDSGQKRQLAVVSEALFDGFLEADREKYGPALIRLGNKIADRFKKTKVAVSDRPEFVRNEIHKNAADLKTLKAFAAGLAANLVTTSKLSSGWFGAFKKMKTLRPRSWVPIRKVTTVRRGLGRIIPISKESDVKALIKSVRVKGQTSIPEYMNILGMANSLPNTKLFRVSDPEIEGLVNLLDMETICRLWSQARMASNALSQACSGIARAEDFSKFHVVVKKKYVRLATRAGMEKGLNDCFKNPGLILGEDLGLAAPDAYGVWLFDYLMTVIKAHSGKQQGYGYTRLDGEAKTGLGTGIGPHVSEFIARRKPLRPDLLSAFSLVLASRLKAIGQFWFDASNELIAGFYLRALFEDKVYKSSKLAPLLFLIDEKLRGNKYVRNNRFPTLLTDEAAGKNISTVDVIKVSSSIVIWQSATDKGVGHKTKELMGRIGMLRVSRNSKGALVPNTKIKKVALVIDGTWTAAQIKRLQEAGADGIFYPDEMDELAAFLKP